MTVSIVTWVSTEAGMLSCLHMVWHLHLCLLVLVLVSEAVVLLARIQKFSPSISRPTSGQLYWTEKVLVGVACTKGKLNKHKKYKLVKA